MRSKWIVRGSTPKGKPFRAEVMADSRNGAMTQAVMFKGYGSRVSDVSGPYAVGSNQRRYGGAPCDI